MADSSSMTPNDTTTGETTALPVSPTLEPSELPSYSTGEARVTRTRRGSTGTPRAHPYSNSPGNTSTRTPRPTFARQWDWLPTTLNAWRTEEEIQTSPDSMDISPYTQEPIHHTVPVLTARLHRHETRLESLDREQFITTNYSLLQVHDRMSHLHQEQEDMTHRMEMIHQQVIDDRGATDQLQVSVEECEQRIREVEEYARGLVQRLVLAEDNARQASRLADTVDRLVAMMGQINLRRD